MAKKKVEPTLKIVWAVIKQTGALVKVLKSDGDKAATENFATGEVLHVTENALIYLQEVIL